ncbi:lipopolysaccharide kinase InaA family protein [Acinetobacter sp. ANC 3882]|uniref:lipopolysaccharide kinase InaA family protein n=1 Tax=Acinetobacter sp. ANC 3882 TaxID=2923423 RepID=UPI001F4B46EF|nr:lipopolysaccharide kinase InaA family protein [Acinetobacter sp. ANC 3882]MCH7314827.1 lipopolysaccharide kinase InaA family protein [Acinetobacter sp. ANC 3882]
MSDFETFLESTLKTQQDSIQSYELDSRKVWLKKASERHGLWLYTPLKWLAKIFNLGSITPVPNQGGSTAIQCEFKRIQQLKALGISTPNVLALSKKGILLEDVGSQRQSPVSQLDQKLGSLKDHTEEQFQLFHKAIQSISQLHQQQGYLSEAFARNILVDQNNQFTFIDFETDPQDVLSLHDCYVRDWLLFIFSTAYHFEFEQLEQASQVLYQALQDEPQVYKDICKVGKRLNWVLRLNVSKVGNDGKRIQKCVLFLCYLKQQADINKNE